MNSYSQFNTKARLDAADAELIIAMQMRAQLLRNGGHEQVAADLEIAAGRLAEHAHVPDNTSVPQADDAALSADSSCPICADTGRTFGNRCTCPVGQKQIAERRLRPRAINPTTPGCRAVDACCENENRNINGGCDSCGDPCL